MTVVQTVETVCVCVCVCVCVSACALGPSQFCVSTVVYFSE